MMNGNLLAAEVLKEMGGEVTPERLAAFQKLCEAVVKHIQRNLQVTAVGTAPPGGGPVTTTSTIIL
jgi:hypothetical protein